MYGPSWRDDRPPAQRLAENVGSFRLSLLAWTFAGHATDVQRDDYRGLRAALLADAQRGLLDVPALVAECPTLDAFDVLLAWRVGDQAPASRRFINAELRQLDARLRAEWDRLRRDLRQAEVERKKASRLRDQRLREAYRSAGP